MVDGGDTGTVGEVWWKVETGATADVGQTDGEVVPVYEGNVVEGLDVIGACFECDFEKRNWRSTLGSVSSARLKRRIGRGEGRNAQ